MPRPSGSYDEKLIVCCLTLTSGWISGVGDLVDMLEQWRRKRPPFVVVGALFADPVVFCQVTNVLRLPTPVSHNRAADLFGLPPFAVQACTPAFRHNSRTPDAVGLLGLWRDAVDRVHRYDRGVDRVGAVLEDAG